jgi:hypothetical protein
MSLDLDSLPPDVQALLRAERGSVSVPSAGRARLAERLSVVVPSFGPPHAPTLPPAASPAVAGGATLKGTVAKLLLGLALSGGAVGGAAAWTREHATTAELQPRMDRPPRAPDARGTERQIPPEVVSRDEAPALPASPQAASSRARADAPSARASAPESLAEHRLLDGAQRALQGGDPGAALAITDRYARTFPRGTLAVVGLALRVRALARLGRKDEAQRLLVTMRDLYPESFLLEGAQNDVDAIP